MSEPSSIFARICMSRAACEKWLDSPIGHIRDYSDWHRMNPIAASSGDEWHEAFPPADYMSVREFLDAAADTSRYFCCEYDDDREAFFIADARHRSSMPEIAAAVAALRNAAAYKDNDEPSFLYVFPAISGGDPEALLQILRGTSGFLPVNDASPDVLYFVNEAEEFIETLLEDEPD